MKVLFRWWLDGCRVLGRFLWFYMVIYLMVLPFQLLAVYVSDPDFRRNPPFYVIGLVAVAFVVLAPFIMHLASLWTGEFRKASEGKRDASQQLPRDEDSLPPFIMVATKDEEPDIRT